MGGTIFLSGNYANNSGSLTALDELNGTLRMNGTGAQSISSPGIQEVFHNLTIDKPSGDVTLNDPVAVTTTLDLSNGRLTTLSDLLTMRAGSAWVNASNNSFVNGPMEKIGATPFNFPIGKGTVMRQAGISSITTGAATDAFVAEYFPASAYTWGTAMEATLDHVSDCEYWTLDRSSGTPTAVVSLTWQAPNSCGVNNLSELRVARFDDAALPAPGIWRDRGNGGATGTFAAGTIPTAAVQTLWNTTTTAWTLASITANNPLPITLVSFRAQPEGSMVRLDWTTVSEHENVLFSVERSQDGTVFEHVLDVPGTFNSNVVLHYTDLDRRPHGGLSYYRLRQTDANGTQSVSPMVAVNFGTTSGRPMVVFANDGGVSAWHTAKVGSTYELVDMSGRLIVSGRNTQEGRTDVTGLTLSPGAYVLRVIDGDHVESQRFVY